MHVAYVARQSFPLGVEGHLGGIGRYAETMSLGLTALGARVTVLSQSADDRLEMFKTRGVDVVRLPKWDNDSGLSWRLRELEAACLRTAVGKRLWGGVWGSMSDKMRRAMIVAKYLPRVAAELGAPFDVVEFAECGAEGLFCLRRTDRPPAIVRIHCPTQLLLERNRFAPCPSDRLLVRAERAAARRAEVVSAPSRSAADRARTDWGLTRAAASVIPNLYDTSVFAPPAHDDPAKRGPFTVVYTGRLERLKGVMHLPAVAEAMAARGLDFRIRLIGGDTDTAPGGRSMRAWLETAAGGKIRDRLEFTGQLGERALAAELRQAHVGIYLSDYETFGYTALEAQACGLTVLATRAGGLAEIVEDGVTGYLVEATNHKGIAALLAKLHDDPNLRRRLGAAAATRARVRFSMQAGGPAFINFYRSVAASASPGQVWARRT